MSLLVEPSRHWRAGVSLVASRSLQLWHLRQRALFTDFLPHYTCLEQLSRLLLEVPSRKCNLEMVLFYQSPAELWQSGLYFCSSARLRISQFRNSVHAKKFAARPDWSGCLLPLSLWFFCSRMGGNQYPWNSPTVIGLFVGFGSTILGLHYGNYTRETSNDPFSVLDKGLSYSAFYSAFSTGSYVIPAYYLLEWFQLSKAWTQCTAASWCYLVISKFWDHLLRSCWVVPPSLVYTYANSQPASHRILQPWFFLDLICSV